VPAVTAEQMREVDRIAMEEFGLGILQMMENAGRSLAENVLEMLDGVQGQVTVLAGSGGNGGGGLCCARHLHNRGWEVRVALSKEAEALAGTARDQFEILQAAGVRPIALSQVRDALYHSRIVVDALIGYSLRGAPQGRIAELIDLCNQHATRTLSLDVPSGLDATTGRVPAQVVRPERTLTLALPKTGLRDACGELYLADIGIPPEVYQRLGLSFKPPFEDRYWIALERG
jgi:NAD(P)H-hydrate epimerase